MSIYKNKCNQSRRLRKYDNLLPFHYKKQEKENWNTLPLHMIESNVATREISNKSKNAEDLNSNLCQKQLELNYENRKSEYIDINVSRYLSRNQGFSQLDLLEESLSTNEENKFRSPDSYISNNSSDNTLFLDSRSEIINNYAESTLSPERYSCNMPKYKRNGFQTVTPENKYVSKETQDISKRKPLPRLQYFLQCYEPKKKYENENVPRFAESNSNWLRKRNSPTNFIFNNGNDKLPSLNNKTYQATRLATEEIEVISKTSYSRNIPFTGDPGNIQGDSDITSSFSSPSTKYSPLSILSNDLNTQLQGSSSVYESPKINFDFRNINPTNSRTVII